MLGNAFGRLLADYASAALVRVYLVRRDYALSELIGDGVDTVGVWGSNPHAPTIFFDHALGAAYRCWTTAKKLVSHPSHTKKYEKHQKHSKHKQKVSLC